MGFLNYEKGSIQEHNNKRCCGLWFIIIGLIIIISSIFGKEQKINPIIFTLGYGVGFYIAIVNKNIRTKLSWGESSKFQDNMASISVLLLFIMMFILSGPFFATQNWRMIWLGTFLAVGLHFFVFYFVHGISMIAIAILCSANAIIGMLFPQVPFIVLAFSDGIIKIGFGIYLLFYSKPSKCSV